MTEIPQGEAKSLRGNMAGSEPRQTLKVGAQSYFVSESRFVEFWLDGLKNHGAIEDGIVLQVKPASTLKVDEDGGARDNRRWTLTFCDGCGVGAVGGPLRHTPDCGGIGTYTIEVHPAPDKGDRDEGGAGPTFPMFICDRCGLAYDGPLGHERVCACKPLDGEEDPRHVIEVCPASDAALSKPTGEET